MSDDPGPSALDKLATTLGHVAIRWNDIHFFTFALFYRMIADADRAEAIFFAIRTDRAQRDMTAALAKSSLGWIPALRDEITKHLTDVGQLAGRRNDVLHGMWLVGHPTLFPTLLPASAPRLQGKDLAVELDRLLGDLDDAGYRAAKLTKELQDALFERSKRDNRLAAYLMTPAQDEPVLPPDEASSPQSEEPKSN